MNIFQTAFRRALLPALALPLLALGLAACDIDSVDSTTSNLADNSGNPLNFAGLYANNSSSNGLAPLVFPTGKQSGVALTWLRLLQYGSVIEAYDNAGMTWAGSISITQGDIASFSLRGRTTAGIATEIAGTLSFGSGSTSQSVMDAAWIEPSFSGNLYAIATVAPVSTNSPSPTNSPNVILNANPATVGTNGTTQLTASGGSSYTWTISPTTYGNLNHTSNYSTNSFTRTSGTSANSVTITVKSGSESDDVTIEFD